MVRSAFVLNIHQISYISLWLIIPFCSVISHTVVAVPPTVFFMILALIPFFVLCTVIENVKIPIVNFIPVVIVVYLLITQPLVGAPFKRFFGLMLPFVYFVLITALYRRISQESLYILIRQFLNITIVILIIECIWRLTHPEQQYSIYEGTGDVRWIYQYKLGGLMYSDSNGAALHILCVFFFLIYLEKRSDKNLRIFKLILIGLMLLTFSRAGYLAMFIGYLYYRYLFSRPFIYSVLIFCVLTFFLAVLYFIYIRPLVANDISFQSKFEIAKEVIAYLGKADFFELLFGIGVSMSKERFGIYAHNYAAVLLVETGIIGFVLFGSFFASLIIRTAKKVLIILVPFFIITLSATTTFIPYFFVILAIIYCLEDQRNDKISGDHSPGTSE